MPKYLLVYYGGMSPESLTEAQRNKEMKAWTRWFEKLGKAVVEMGAPTSPGKTVGKAGARATGANAVAGYSIIKANNLGAAVNLAKSNPGVSTGTKIAVHEIMEM